MTKPTTMPEALTEIEELRGQVRDLLRLLGQEALHETGAAGGPQPMFATQASAEIGQQQAEREWAQTMAELRNVIETIPDVMFRLDLQGNVTAWNTRMETVTGFVPKELNGRSVLSLVPEYEHEKTAAAILRAREEGYAELEGHLLTKDQRTIPYHWTGTVLKNDEGHVIGVTGVGRDVSEKKHIEAELRRQQQHLLAAQAMAHVGSWDWDIVSGAMEWSEEQFRIFGYEPKAIPATYERFLAAVLSDDHDRVVASIHATLAGKKPLDMECRVVRPSGEIRTVHCLGRIVRAEDGSPDRLSGSTLDITERTRAEHSLLKTRDLLTSFVENMPVAVAMLDRELRYVAVSRRWITDYRLGGESLIGRRHYEVFPEIQDMKEWQEIHQRGLSGSVERCEEDRFVRADGSEEWLRWEVRPWRDITGEIAGIIIFTEVITERKQADEALRASEERYARATAIGKVGVWELDPVRAAFRSDDNLKAMLGYAREELSTDPFAWLDLVYPDDQATALGAWNRVTQGLDDSYSYEVRMKRKDGTTIWTQVRGQANRDETGSVTQLIGATVDITERKRAEAALRQSESHFRALIENSSDIITVLDFDGTIRFESPSFERLLGYAQDEIDGRIAFDFMHPDDLPTVIEKFQLIVQRPGETQTAEFRFRHKDGSWRSFEGVGRATCDSHGRPCVIANSRDITGRKREEEERLNRETLLSLMLNTGPGCIMLVASDGRLLHMNRAGLHMIEAYHEEDAIGRSAYDLVVDEHRVSFMEMHQSVIQGSAQTFQFEIIGLQGNRRWLETHAAPFQNPLTGCTELLAVTHDITERKQVEQTLREREETLARFKATLDQVHDCVFMFDADSLKFVYCNRGAVAQVGYTEDELATMTPLEIEPEFTERMFREMLQPLRDGRRTVQVFETVHRHKDGQEVDVEVCLQFVAGASQVGRFVAVVRDITERKRATEALRESEERFFKAFNEAAIGMALVGLDGCWLQVNRALCNIVGYSKEELEATTFQALTHPDDLDSDLTLLRKLLNGEVSAYQMEKRYFHKQGHVVWIVLNVSLVRHSNGKPQHLIGQMQDVTEQKRAEEALAHNHGLLTAIMDASTDLIYIKDLQGRYLHINRAGAEAVGMSAEAVIGWDDVALWGGELAVSRHTSDRFVATSGKTIMVEEQGTVLGDIADFLTTKAPYRDAEGRIVGVIGIARNITEWKRVDEERRKALTLLTNVINATPDLIFVKDRDLRTILCNDAFARAIGKTPQDLIGRTDVENGWDPEFVRGNSDAGVRGYESDDREALTGKVVRIPSEPVNVNGEVRMFDTYKVPLRDETGAVISILGVSRDVTDRKRMEETLAHRERDLRAALDERERISEDLHDGILQSIYAVGLGLESCGMLISELPLPRKKTIEPLMATLNRAIGELNHVMADVRNFIAGLESDVLQGGDVASALRTMVQGMCKYRGIACRVAIEEAAVRELSTEQAYHVLNIVREALSNSLRHGKAVRITLSLRQLRRSIRVAVGDDGIGFLPDSARDVGHGLANMTARAQKLGGRLNVHSRPRQGTKVQCDIPRRSVYA